MRNRLRFALGLCAGLTVASALHAEDEKLTVQIGRLTMETALAIAQGAVEACRAQAVSVSAVVVDRDGVVQVSLRDTLAPPVSLRVSREKAYTAANFQAETSSLGALADGPVGRIPGVTMSSGGVPIEAAGQIFGGVGVSGAPSGAVDEACAKAGVDAVRDDLEMSL